MIAAGGTSRRRTLSAGTVPTLVTISEKKMRRAMRTVGDILFLTSSTARAGSTSGTGTTGVGGDGGSGGGSGGSGGSGGGSSPRVFWNVQVTPWGATRGIVTWPSVRFTSTFGSLHTIAVSVHVTLRARRIAGFCWASLTT